ncbi:hypothetical protein [Methanothrix sp.]|uniref:hypothetical protein n=1 Tax=Methanothrix sp. TaxID=90426 RepID=UPI0025E5D9B2|nr:hypothetical protein [Methanothrix sp.]
MTAITMARIMPALVTMMELPLLAYRLIYIPANGASLGMELRAGEWTSLLPGG